MDTTRFCGDCGARIKQAAAHCTGCGVSQESSYGTVTLLAPSAPAPAAPPPAAASPPPAPMAAPPRPPVTVPPAPKRAAQTRTLEPAGLGQRFIASCTDSAIEFAVALTFLLLVLGSGPSLSAFLLCLLVMAAVGSLAPAALAARTGPSNGQSFGKQVMGLRIVRIDGGSVGLSTTLIRETVMKRLLFGFVGSLLILPSLINALWPFFNDERRALHDRSADTLVVAA